MKIFCIIPAWNEAGHINQVVREIKTAVDEVIVVDDCSADQTSLLAKQAGAIVLRHIINRDQGAALRTGTKYAIQQSASDQDIIVHFDADGQMRAQDIATVIRPLQTGQAEVVFGSRFLNNQTKMPWTKKNLIMPLARLANRLFFNVRLTDPQSGFRAMTVKAAKQLDWWQDGKGHASEILYLVHQQKLKIVEAPIVVIYHHFGQRLSVGLGILKDIFIAKLIH